MVAFVGWVGSANGMYKDTPNFASEEAIRSGAWAAMNLMIAVGKPAPGNWPRKPRFSVEKVLSFNTYKNNF
jgi:hypothetical protein